MPEPIGDAMDGPEPASGPGRVVTGVAASAGRVEGRARVVLDPDCDVVLEPGDILVCRITDPSWAPLFTLAEGLVIDIGGPASHGAIVARELGIPCVIGTGNGTTAIHDGDRVAVDGDAGTVSVLP
jgi:pyruvate,water dikinase